MPEKHAEDAGRRTGRRLERNEIDEFLRQVE